MIYKTLFSCPVHRPLRITAGQRREVIGGLQGNVWASADCESPGRPRGTVAQPAKISSAFLKPAWVPFESRKDSAYGDKRNDHTGTEPRDAKCETQRGMSPTSVTPPSKKKTTLFNVSGFKRTNANGIQREANIYFRLVFWLTVEELEDEVEPSPRFLSDSLVTYEMFPKGKTLPSLDTWPAFDRRNKTEHQSSDSSPRGTECHFLCKFDSEIVGKLDKLPLNQ